MRTRGVRSASGPNQMGEIPLLALRSVVLSALSITFGAMALWFILVVLSTSLPTSSDAGSAKVAPANLASALVTQARFETLAPLVTDVHHDQLSQVQAYVSACSVPGAPPSVAATSGANRASITWQKSAANGSALTGYVVTAFPGGSVAANAVGTSGSTKSVTLTGLAGGTSYIFHVYALNACGAGPATASNSVVPSGSSTTYSTTVIADVPSVYYRLGETSGTVLADSSGNADNGTYTSSATLDKPGAVIGDPDTAVSDNGSGPVATVPPGGLPVGNTARTMEAWVHTTGSGTYDLAGYGASGTDQSFSIGVDPNDVLVSAGNDNVSFSIGSGIAINDGTWHQIVVTYSGSGGVIDAYLDGVFLGSDAFAGTLSTTNQSSLQLGSGFGAASPLSGTLDEVSVYPVALTPAQVLSQVEAAGYVWPSAPRSVAAAYGGANAATVSWAAATARGAAITGYVVTAYSGSTPENAVAADPNQTAVRLYDLAGSTAYTFKVYAVNADGSGPPGTSASFTPSGVATTYASQVISDRPTVYYRLGEHYEQSEVAGSYAANSNRGGHLATYTSAATTGAPGAIVGDPETAVTGSGSGPIAILAPDGLPSGNIARSVEVWVQTVGGGPYDLAGYGSTGTGSSFNVAVDASHVYVSAGGTDTLSFPAPSLIAINDGAWHLIDVTYNGTNVTAYLDGNSLGSQSFPAALSTDDTSGLHIGSDFASDNPLAGSLEELAIYPSALTATQVATDFQLSGNAVPAAPTSVNATNGSGNGVATVTWQPPASNVLGYIVYSVNSSTTTAGNAVGTAQNSATISGLVGGKYSFEVYAVNAYGAGPAASSSTVTIPGPSNSTYSSTVIGNHPSVYYRLEDAPGSPFAADSSGQGPNGFSPPNSQAAYTTNATLGTSPGAIVGDPDNTAVTGNGSGPIALLAPDGLPSGNTARSVEVWVQTTGSGPYDLAGYGSTATGSNFNVAVDANHVYVSDGGTDTLSFPAPSLVAIDNGAWHLVDVTYNGTSVTAYLDGNLLGSQSFPGALSTDDTSGLHIGSDFSGADPLAGSLDDLAIYPTELTATQVATDFQLSGNATRVPPAPSNVKAMAGPEPGQATISWQPPSGTVTGYVVTALVGGSTPANAVATTQTKVILSDLVGGTSYSFQVYGVNSSGPGPATTSSTVSITGPATTYASTVIGDHPSVYYRFGEAPGSPYAADSSGSNPPFGETATYTGSATLGTPGAIYGDPDDTGVTGDGSGPIATIPPDNLPSANQARSIGAWVQTTGSGPYYLAGYGTAGTNTSFSVGIDADDILVSAGGDMLTFPTGAHVVNNGVWHQVIVTYNGAKVVAYLDGAAIGSQTLTGALSTDDTSGLQMGSDFLDDNSLVGSLEELAVYPVALSASQVVAQFDASGNEIPPAPSGVSATAGPGSGQATITWTAPTGYRISGFLVTESSKAVKGLATAVSSTTTSLTMSGLPASSSYTFQVVAFNPYGTSPNAKSSAVTVSGPSTTYASAVVTNAPSVFYRLGDPSGLVAADSSGHGDRATYSSSAGLGISGPVYGDDTTAASGNGSGPIATAEASSALPAGNASRSLEAWVQTTGAGPYYLAGYGGSGTDTSFSVGVDASDVIVSAGDDVVTFPAGNTDVINNGAWHQVVVTYDGLNLTAYLDGVSLGTQSFAGLLSTATQGALNLGSDYAGKNALSGSLGEVALYPTALSANNVANKLSLAGRGMPTTASNPSASGGSNEATVSWTAATAPPGSPILGYMISASQGSTEPTNSIATGPSSTSVSLTGLASGSGYTFEVYALNADGAGPTTISVAVTVGGTASTYASTVVGNDPSLFYRLGDSSGSPYVADSSGNAQVASYQPAATLGASGAIAADPASAVTGNGSGPVFFKPGETGLPVANKPRTVEVWVKTTGSGIQDILGWGSSGIDRSFTLAMDPNDLLVFTDPSDDLDFPTPQALNDGQWHYIVVTYDRTNLAAYVDGSVVGTTTFSYPLSTSPSPGLYVASDWTGGATDAFNGTLDDVAVYPSALTASQVSSHFAAGAPPAPIVAGLVGASSGTTYSASGTGNSGAGVVGYGYATECTGPVPFSIGNYPPNTCVQQGGQTNGVGFYFSGDSQCFSENRPDSGSTFTWTAKIPLTGHWEVQAFIPYWTNYNLGATYDVSSDSGTSSAGVNQQADAGQWVTLVSSAPFTAGNTYSVTLGPSNSYDSDCHYQPGDHVQWKWVSH